MALLRRISLVAVVGLAAAVALSDDTPMILKPKKVLDAIMSSDFIPESEKSSNYWRNSAMNTIRQKLETRINVNKAKNGILFIGDGMSLATVMAARTFAGQLKKYPGEETRLAFEEFPVSGLSKTYCLDAQVPDSACTATAYLTGVKTKYGTIGLNGNVTRASCQSQLHKGNWVQSIAEWALHHGLDAGFVTSTRVTHASPAGTYAHVAERNWESDADLSKEAASLGCMDIASQMVIKEPGNRFKVILGGGRREFLPKTSINIDGRKLGGKRLDGVDLTEYWHIHKIENNFTHQYVTDRDGLLKVASKSQDEMPDYLLGLFHEDHMEYHLKATEQQPTLEQMTEVAIKMLSRNPQGYFLFVEGGRIDHAHHDNYAHLAMDETVEYAKAVQKARQMTSEEDTLIVVSSDHAHTMSVAGYPSRGNDILGVVDTAKGSDAIPYTTLSYANGKGYRKKPDGSRPDVTLENSFNEHDVNYQYPATVPLDSETHGGEDVAVWALGPWQHLFTSSYEQNVIPHLIAFAMCIGDDRHDACHSKQRSGTFVNSSYSVHPSIISLVAAVIVSLLMHG